MDQIQDQLDPEVAQEVISALNRKVANLRSENAELQGQLFKSSVAAEKYKSELESRPGPGEVAALEDKLKECNQRGEEWGKQVNQLNAELEKLESERQEAAKSHHILEKRVGELLQELNIRTEENGKLAARLKSLPNTFEVPKFLDGKLVNLPPRPSPALMTREEKRWFTDVIQGRGENIFFASLPRGIIWAGEAGGCVVPLPSVIYNAKTKATEGYRYKPVVNQLYQFCGVDDINHHRTYHYHGMYRCIAVVRADWARLQFIDEKVAGPFLNRVVVEKCSATPDNIYLFDQMYKTGVLKVDYVVLQYERFDDDAVKQVQPAGGPLTTINVPSPHTGDKRPSDQYQEWAGGPVKKPRLKN